jgi:hypothetical protein
MRQRAAMKEDDMITHETADRLLTEVERQQKYLSKLPKDYTFPLFNAKQALESQRRSGYRNTAAAAREIVDNAIEAGATRVNIAFERPSVLKPYQRQNSVTAVAFIDNGSGMLPDMARYALSWGSGTHFDDPAFIGKFGFGLPNASINQTRLVDVYTKIAGEEKVFKATLDARQVAEYGLQEIPEPVEAELPTFVQEYMQRHELDFEHGTIVVWMNPDRLSVRTDATLREHLVDDFGVTYRYILPKVDITVDAAKVEPVDPLFLTPTARYYVPPEEGGAQLTGEWNLAVKYFQDLETGAVHLEQIEPGEEINAEEPNLIAVGRVTVRVSRLPVGFAEGSGDSDARRRFEIRKTRRGMSFVRAGREIETVDVFPKSIRDEAKGLGRWPLLQTFAYHWGVEVQFDPDLDEVMGITNDKQTVRPMEEVWRLFASVGIDDHLRRENRWQEDERKQRNIERLKNLGQESQTPTPAERAAASADSVGGTRTIVPDRGKDKARSEFEEEARRRSTVNQTSIDEARKALELEAKKRPYVIRFIDEPRGPFYRPEWEFGSRVAVLVNRAHPFYKSFYAPLLDVTGGGQARQALDVLLIALARAELRVDDDQAAMWYEAQRERQWSPFLSDALRVLQQTLKPEEEEAHEPQVDDEAEAGGDERREAAE